MKFQVELVWNREFSFVCFGDSCDNLDLAVGRATRIADSGDGARVKEARVVDDWGRIVWENGKFSEDA